MLSSFMGLHPFSAVPAGFQELVNGKSEEPIALATDTQVAAGGNAVGPFLPHDVHESPPASELAGADAFDIQRHLGFVVEAGVSFVAIQRQFILVGDLPDRNGDRASLLRLGREIGAGLAALEQEPVVLQFRSANDPRPGAAPAHLLDIEVATVGNVVSFHSVNLPFRGAHPFYHRKPASAGSGASGRRPSSGCSAVAEGCVTGKAAGQDVACGFELLADEAQAEEPGAHGVFGVLVLLGLGAGSSHRLGHLAEGQAKLNVALQLAGVKAVAFTVGGGIKLEKPELDCAFGKSGVEVEHMVAAVIVMVASSVVGTLAPIPNVGKVGHGGGLPAVDLFQEAGINRAAVPAHAVTVEVEGFGQQTLVAGHNVGQVAQGLRCVPLGSDVDMDSAAPGGVALGTRPAKPANQLLQGSHVGVGQNWGDQLTFFAVRAGNGNVLLEFPLASLAVPSAPGAVPVAVGGVFIAPGAKELGGDLCCPAAVDVVHLDLDPDGLLLHFLDLDFRFLVHGSASWLVLFSLSVVSYYL